MSRLDDRDAAVAVPGPRSDADRPAGAAAGLDAGLDARESAAWDALAPVLGRLPAALDGQLHQDAGLSFFEYRVLVALARAPGGVLRLGELASAVAVSPSRLSRAMARLEHREWASRRPDPDDGRYILGTITDSGRRTVDDATPAHIAQVRRLVFDQLTDDEVDQLSRIGARIRGAIPD